MASKPKKGFIKIDTELCPMNVISVSEKLNQKGYHPAAYNEEDMELERHQCRGCALCALVCPDIAIEVYCE